MKFKEVLQIYFWNFHRLRLDEVAPNDMEMVSNYLDNNGKIDKVFTLKGNYGLYPF